MDPYLGLTGHYISKNWTMERWMLNCGKINGRHTAQVIGTKLDELIDDLKLDDHVHIMITTDNAKSMLNATQKVSDRVGTGLSCIDHILQLIINNAVKKVPEIQTAVKRLKKLAKATHKSYHNVERIRKGCTDLNRSELDTSKHCTFIKIEKKWPPLVASFIVLLIFAVGQTDVQQRA